MQWIWHNRNDLTTLIVSGRKAIGKVVHYSQKNNNYCTYFAVAGCLAFNTGKELTQEEVLNLAQQHTIASTLQTAKKLKETLNFSIYQVDLTDWLRRWTNYAIAVSFSAPPELYLDGQDGKVDLEYSREIGKWHAMWLYRRNKKIILVNSWWLKEIDITGQIMNMLKNKVINKEGIILA